MNYQVDFKNKMVLAIERNEDISSMIDNGKPTRKTIQGWYDMYKSNGLFKKESNNDAIPSWSGYNYQGKMMLLLTLQMMNKLIFTDDNSFNHWGVELEKKQDFVFIKNSVVESLYQVKACLSKTTVAGYEEALEKLIEDKELSTNKNAKCVLISAKDITDWGTTKNKFKDRVELYKYRDEVVSILGVIDYIKMELEKLLNNIKVNTSKEDIYLILCDFVDRKISQYHDGGKKSNYNILFSEIVDYIKCVSIDREEIEKLKFKEYIYKYINKKIEENTMDACEECESICKENCGVLRNYELIKAVALDKYIRYINPVASKEEAIESVFNNNIYTDNICEVYKAVDSNIISEENNLIFFSHNYGSLKVIPTIIQINSSSVRTSKSLIKINQNEVYKSLDSEFVLSGDIGCRLLQTKGDKFTNTDRDFLMKNNKIVIEKDISIKDVLDNTNKKDKKISFSQNITIINKDDLITYIMEGE
ncbi:ABC-three component system protein [Hathewaya massiliensis]|uniref:ABC-three component system protein n=1 Tax=Hathewaya massiliensis TaxID=1964382 RepID=UPI00115945A7|nr:ABC-three component system protein [Hathewaya massiliensis]